MEVEENTDNSASHSEEWTPEEENQQLDSLFESVSQGHIDLDSVMAGSVSGGKHNQFDAEHLSKVWCIDHDTAKRTIDITSQRSVKTNDLRLYRNFGTNDRMIRYNRIKDYFFMNTFFAAKKGGKSTRGNTCCQLFVTHKRFIYVVPMKS